MFLKPVRCLFVAVLLFTSLIGGMALSRPVRGDAASGDLTASTKVLSQSGTVGKWAIKEQSGLPGVQCKYPSGTDSAAGMRVANVEVYPRPDLNSEVVEVTTAIKRRLPDGSLQSLTTQPNHWTRSGTATTATPFQMSPPWSFYWMYGDLGSNLVQTVSIWWGLSGRVELLITKYQTTLVGPPDQTFAATDACYPALPATGTMSNSTVTVDQWVDFNYFRMPHDPALGVGIYIDGVLQMNWNTNSYGNGSYHFPVKPRPMGKHTIKAYRYGRSTSATFTIIPRIKVRPHKTHTRGETVDISLRGYAKYETVNIRWKKGASWVQIAQVKTSGTGSANVYVKVPTWVPDGKTSVRGDGQYGHAQTNDVYVSGGLPLTSSSVKPLPSPTPSATATTSATPESTPISTPEATATAVPTEQPATPEVTPSETVTPEPTETTTSTETPQATETPSPEPTVVPTETPEPTATEV